jgi:hypothetical protein
MNPQTKQPETDPKEAAKKLIRDTIRQIRKGVFSF